MTYGNRKGEAIGHTPHDDGMSLWQNVEDGGYAECEEHSGEKPHADTVDERKFRRKENIDQC